MDSEAVGGISLFVIVARNSRTQGEFAGGPVGGLHLDGEWDAMFSSTSRRVNNP